MNKKDQAESMASFMHSLQNSVISSVIKECKTRGLRPGHATSLLGGLGAVLVAGAEANGWKREEANDLVRGIWERAAERQSKQKETNHG